MSSRLAVISIIIENPDTVETVNRLLHDASKYIIGRMGVPYREKKISLISVALDAPQDVISALSGSIGHLNGVSSKTAYSNIITECEENGK
ncbi:MAG: iron-only hydrogenase system regulator [Lachnospiraceae bacterium]|nr:iron-only hydrogenase system regulator [Lachnospiraceae bacterium]